MNVTYTEKAHFGYRYYDINNIEPKYPFGFGLSYTTFNYSNISVQKVAPYNYTVTFSVKNTGKFIGSEVA